MTPAIALMGPTASGKTALAIELAQAIDGEVISVDSALIYRGMDIGTAKPTQEERQGIAHWLIDTHDPSQSYSVSAFFDDAAKLVEDISSRGKVPILTGGTMLYFSALEKGISPLPETNPDVRQQLAEQAQTQGWQILHDRLKEVDPVSAERIHPNDPQRLLRAMEVHQSTGKSLTYWQNLPARQAPFSMHSFAIAPVDRTVLHQRIATRFNKMLDEGFVKEVEKLHQRPDLHTDLPAIRSVGYRQIWNYLDGVLTFDEMVERGIIATRQLAKRQLTWLRGWSSLCWLDTFGVDNLHKMLAKIGR